jgi:uncharacterized Tic20 family protein
VTMPPFDDLIGWFFKVILAGVMSFLWWGKKEDKKLLDTHAKEIVRLKSTAVTEDKVREIVTQVTSVALHPMIETMAEIKRIVNDNMGITKAVQLKMAEQEGYQNALKELSLKQ